MSRHLFLKRAAPADTLCCRQVKARIMRFLPPPCQDFARSLHDCAACRMQISQKIQSRQHDRFIPAQPEAVRNCLSTSGRGGERMPQVLVNIRTALINHIPNPENPTALLDITHDLSCELTSQSHLHTRDSFAH